MKIRLIHSLLLSIILSAVSGPVFAGAWTQEPNKGIAILTLNSYQASHLYTNSGKSQKQSKYSKLELIPYGEYGLCEGVTLGGSVSLPYAWQNGERHYGIGESEFFVRTRLLKQDNWVVSVAPLIKLPTPTSQDDNPVLGGSHADAGVTLSGGYSFEAFGQHHFAALDTGYRYRFGEPHDQLKVDATLGFALSKQWMLMPQLFVTHRLGESSAPRFTLSSGDDYNLTTLRVSAVYQLQSSTSLQVGGYRDIDGKNAGKGTGMVLGIWRKF